jgi:acetylornithine/N-succinyldiaminopimelate aminotransferase
LALPARSPINPSAKMRDIIPAPLPIVHNQHAEIRALFSGYVVPTYGRFDLTLSHGTGSEVWDVSGKRYLDLGGGIAVCALGHAHPEITETLIEQSRRLVHVSNLYYQGPQGLLARALVQLIGPGRIFFCNSGAEANEGLYKLARKFGNPEGRFEILTALNSFHGRTLGGISATGQDKVKQGFGPLVPGFRHIPFNDLQAAANALSPATAAILIEGIQGEGGVTPATASYLVGLRELCDRHRILLLIDGVQCGHFRSGRFQSFQRILEGVPGTEGFLPDGIAMAKSLGGGFPMGAFWVRNQAHGIDLGQLLGPGSHGTTYGGSPLGCAVALKILEIIHRDRLAHHVRQTGDHLRQHLLGLPTRFPDLVADARGMGFMQGIELLPKDKAPAFNRSDAAPSMQLVNKLHAAGVLTIPSGTSVVRLLPALNLPKPQLDEGLRIIDATLESFR